MSEGNKIGRYIISVLSSNIASQFLSLVRSFTMPLLLGPVDFGRWNLLSVLLGYAANSHLGLLHGMGKMIPRLVANDDIDGRTDVKNSVLFGVILLAFCFSLVLSVCMLGTDYSNWMLPVSVMILLQSIYIYYLCLHRANGEFNLLSWTSLFYAVVLTVFVLGGAYVYKKSLDGAAYGMIVAQLIVVLLLIFQSRRTFRIQAEFGIIRKAFIIGLPQTLIGMVDMVVYTIDRWIVASNFTSIELGYYAFAGLFPIVIAAIPIASSQVLYNYFLKFSIDSDGKAESREYILLSVAIVSAIVSFIVVLVNYVLPLLVKFWFEKYVDAVPLAQTLLFGSYFFSLSHIAGTFLIANDMQYRLIFIQLIAAMFGIFFSFFLMDIGWGLISVAFGTVVLYVLYGLGYLYLAVLVATSSPPKALKYCFYISLPMLVFAGTTNLAKIFIGEYEFGEFLRFSFLVLMPCAFNAFVFLFLYRSLNGLTGTKFIDVSLK